MMLRCQRLSAAMLGAGQLLAAGAHAFESAPPVLAAQGSVQAAFAPWDDVEGVIVAALDGASNEILVQSYLFTSRKIAQALIRAQARGVRIRLLADAGEARDAQSLLPELAAAGIPVWLETRYRSAHNKVMIIDHAGHHPAVITGSFNFTWAAQHRNAENIVVLRDQPALAARYAANWTRHRQEAISYHP